MESVYNESILENDALREYLRSDTSLIRPDEIRKSPMTWSYLLWRRMGLALDIAAKKTLMPYQREMYKLLLQTLSYFELKGLRNQFNYYIPDDSDILDYAMFVLNFLSPKEVQEIIRSTPIELERKKMPSGIERIYLPAEVEPITLLDKSICDDYQANKSTTSNVKSFENEEFNMDSKELFDLMKDDRKESEARIEHAIEKTDLRRIQDIKETEERMTRAIKDMGDAANKSLDNYKKESLDFNREFKNELIALISDFKKEVGTLVTNYGIENKKLQDEFKTSIKWALGFLIPLLLTLIALAITIIFKLAK